MAKLSLEELQNALHPRPRHPALVRRDEAYAKAVSHPRLTSDGKLKVDPMPLAVDLIGLRPMSIAEQVHRFTRHDVTDFNLIPDENFLSEDDFHDYLDDLPDEGWSPYELAGFQNIERQYSLGRSHSFADAESDDDATSLPDPVAERPQTAGKAKGSSAEPSGEAE